MAAVACSSTAAGCDCSAPAARGCREAEVETLGGDRAFAIYPFLWAEGPAIGERMRRPVPITETCASALDVRRQLGE